MAERFYTNCELQPGPFVLQGPEAHHLAKVSRLRAGDGVCLFNGNGHEYPARIDSIDKRSVLLEIMDELTPNRELPLSIEVACPLPKGDRAQFLIEKLTELGVGSYVPLRTQRSVVQARGAKPAKLNRYVVEACKQCGRNRLMEVREEADWQRYCDLSNEDKLRLLAHPCERNDAPGKVLPNALGEAGVVIAIGPEGGFTEKEVSLGESRGWQIVDLGSRTLRIETAALLLVSWAIQCRNSAHHRRVSD